MKQLDDRSHQREIDLPKNTVRKRQSPRKDLRVSRKESNFKTSIKEYKRNLKSIPKRKKKKKSKYYAENSNYHNVLIDMWRPKDHHERPIGTVTGEIDLAS